MTKLRSGRRQFFPGDASTRQTNLAGLPSRSLTSTGTGAAAWAGSR